MLSNINGISHLKHRGAVVAAKKEAKTETPRKWYDKKYLFIRRRKKI